jgi:Mrp family chromosome partitioning ATPase
VLVPIREAAELPEDVAREMTRLRVSLESLLLDRASRSTMFVSAQGHEGTSTVAYQFAFTLARDPRIRTLLVDAHARRPTLALGAGEPAASGPSTAPGAARAGEARAVDGWPLAAQYHAVGLLSPALVREVVEWASGRYDWIVFDGPPVLESADAAPIAAVTDGVVIVVESGRTKRPVLQRAVELLRKAGGHVLGSVLNRRRLEIPEFIYRRI